MTSQTAELAAVRGSPTPDAAQPAVDRHGLIADLQAKTHACLADLVTDAPLALLDFPDIRNCGDSAIWLGEMAYLDRFHAAKRPAYVSRIRDFSAAALRRAVPDGPIFIHGGGNFGDIWDTHQIFRERIIEAFPDRTIVQFPQSIHFKEEARLVQAARIVGRHRRFVLLVRDRESQHIAETRFDCEVRLCPDMAFCIGEVERIGTAQFDVLAMLRKDREKSVDMADIGRTEFPTEDWITESRAKVLAAKAGGILSALAAGQPAETRLRMLDAAAHNRFRRGVTQLSRARAIVTDRLHVHIVSTLMGIPHAVLDNSYGKVSNFMNAFTAASGLGVQAASFDDAAAWARAQAGAR